MSNWIYIQAAGQGVQQYTYRQLDRIQQYTYRQLDSWHGVQQYTYRQLDRVFINIHTGSWTGCSTIYIQAAGQGLQQYTYRQLHRVSNNMHTGSWTVDRVFNNIHTGSWTGCSTIYIQAAGQGVQQYTYRQLDRMFNNIHTGSWTGCSTEISRKMSLNLTRRGFLQKSRKLKVFSRKFKPGIYLINLIYNGQIYQNSSTFCNSRFFVYSKVICVSS